jgi:phytoene synthase
MTMPIPAPAAVSARLDPTAARAIIRRHSKSFSLASLLLGEETRDDAVALYAYCRRADDAVDLVSATAAPASIAALERELDAVYAGRSCSEPILAEFQRLVFERHIPRAYPDALLQGLRDDADGARYETLADLQRYCWYVAGSVGGMMCHVLGVRRPRAVAHGVHLGMAMQLTNICRDVAEDWQRGRLYLPAELMPGVEAPTAPRAFPTRHLPVFAGAVRRLLAEAELLYGSGDLGLPYLSFRSRVAVATARRIYSAIGKEILMADANVTAGRAFVSTPAKLWQAGLACVQSLTIGVGAPQFRRAGLAQPLRFPEDVLPV